MHKRLLLVHPKNSSLQRGFTLVELLIVLSILAVLSIATVIVINPVEILAKSRDTQRIADLKSLKSALALYVTTVTTPVLEGTANTLCVGGSGTDTIWYSMPPTQGTIPVTVATTFASVQASTDSSVGRTNGTGWIPVDIDLTTGGAAISNLPIDPNHRLANAGAITNSDLTYRYGCNSNNAATRPTTFELDARMESNFYLTAPHNVAVLDGGDNDNLYEVGTNLGLLPAATSNNF